MAPPLVVATIATPGPTDDTPTAVQSCALTHDTPLKSVIVLGKPCGVHDAPPSVVAMMLGALVSKSLTAMQVDAVGHEIPVRIPVPGGALSVVHVTPPLEVLIMTGLPNLPKMPNPTAVHWVVLGQEMELRPLTAAGMFSGCHA